MSIAMSAAMRTAMSNEQLLYSIQVMQKQAEEGITIIEYAGDYRLKGYEAKLYMNYYDYVQEAINRELLGQEAMEGHQMQSTGAQEQR